jgi:hypothetical protein
MKHCDCWWLTNIQTVSSGFKDLCLLLKTFMYTQRVPYIYISHLDLNSVITKNSWLLVSLQRILKSVCLGYPKGTIKSKVKVGISEKYILPQVTGKLYHIMLYRVHLNWAGRKGKKTSSMKTLIRISTHDNSEWFLSNVK